MTISRATSGFGTAIVEEDTILFGGSHRIVVPRYSDLSITAGSGQTMVAAFRGWAATTSGRIISSENATTFDGNGIYYDATPTVQHRTDDGTTISQGSGTPTNYQRHTFVAAHVNGDQERYLDGVSVDTDTDTLSSTIPGDQLWVGDTPTSRAYRGEFFGAAVLSKRVTDTEAQAIHNEFHIALPVGVAATGYTTGFDEGFF